MAFNKVTFKYFILFCVIVLVGSLTNNVYCQDSETSTDEHALDSLLNLKISTAAKYEQTINEAPASVSVITSEDIARFGYRTIAEALMSIAGLYISYDRNYTYLGIRGFSRPTDYNDRVLLLLDGHMINDGYYGSAPIDNQLGINMASIDRIEIVRGPGSALYGTGAVFAVINIISKKGDTINGINVSVDGGSYRWIEGSLLAGSKFENGFEYSFSALGGDSKGRDQFYPEYNDPASSDGVSRKLDWERYHSFTSTLSYQNYSLTGFMVSRRKGIPTAAFDMTFNDDRAQTLDEQQFLEMKYNRTFGSDINIALRSYYDGYDYRGVYPGTPFSRDANNVKSIGGELQLRWDMSASNRITGGGEYRDNFQDKYILMDADTTEYSKDVPNTSFSLYLQDEIQLRENVMVIFGIRRDAYSIAGNPVSPRVSVVYNLFTTSTLKFLYGEAFRVPNVYEKYYEDVGSNWVTNPALKPERIRTYEFIWEQHFLHSIFGRFSLYNYAMNNLIDPIIDSTTSTEQFENISHVRSTGIETAFKIYLKSGVHGYLNYSYQYSTDINTGVKLTNSPSHIAKAGVGYQLTDYVRAAIEMMYESNRLTVYNTTTDPYFLTNLNLSILPPSGHLRSSLLIRNVFDVSYQTPGGFEHRQSAIKQDGRNFTVRLEYSF